MLGRHGATPEGQRRAADARDVERLHGSADPDDVAERVDRSDLVEVHALDRNAVNSALGTRESLEDVEAALAHALGETSLAQDRADRAKGPAVMVVLSGRERDVAGADRAALDARELHPDRPDPESCDRFSHRSCRCTDVEERAEQHVARRAREAVEMKDAIAAHAGFRRG